MSSIFDVAEDMWNVPITPYLLVEVFNLRPLREDKIYIHMIGFRTPHTHYFGAEPVRVYEWCGRWFIEMQYPYTRNRISINSKLGYPKQIETMRDVVNELEKIYDILENEIKVKIDKKLQV